MLSTEFFAKLQEYLDIIRKHYPGTVVIEIGSGCILIEDEDEIHYD
jgi:hypothetical protein